MSFISRIQSLFYKLGTIDVSFRYSFFLAVFIIIWLLVRVIHRLVRSQWRSTSYFVLKYFVYPYIFPQMPLLGTTTRGEALAGSLYLAINCVLVMFVGVKSLTDISTRAANMSIVNLIPLFCGPRLSLMTQFLGIPYRASLGSHQWFGMTAVTQVLLHAIISLTGNHSIRWTETTISAVVGGSVLGFIPLLSVRLVRRLFYEWFLNSHLVLSFIVLIATWRHVSSKKPAEFIIHTGMFLWIVVSTIQWVLFALRNFVLGKSFATAVAKRVSYTSDISILESANIIQVDIIVPKPWIVKPGEHIFISIPRLGLTGLRGHPFIISWWHRDQTGLTISLLMKSRTGLTKALDMYLDQALYVFIDGPYGVKHSFGEHGTVIMFATGIGIVGHLPYIKDLITGYNNCEVRTQRIVLIWLVQIESQVKWIKPWLDELLECDTGCILTVNLYIQDSRNKVAHDIHPKIKKIPGLPSITEVLQNEFRDHKGKIVVSVCADHTMTKKVRSAVQQGMDSTIRLVELDFEPSMQDKSVIRDMEFQCRG